MQSLRPRPPTGTRWIYVEKELRRRSVTRLLLWEEYRAANPDALPLVRDGAGALANTLFPFAANGFGLAFR